MVRTSSHPVGGNAYPYTQVARRQLPRAECPHRETKDGYPRRIHAGQGTEVIHASLVIAQDGLEPRLAVLAKVVPVISWLISFWIDRCAVRTGRCVLAFAPVDRVYRQDHIACFRQRVAHEHPVVVLIHPAASVLLCRRVNGRVGFLRADRAYHLLLADGEMGTMVVQHQHGGGLHGTVGDEQVAGSAVRMRNGYPHNLCRVPVAVLVARLRRGGQRREPRAKNHEQGTKSQEQTALSGIQWCGIVTAPP